MKISEIKKVVKNLPVTSNFIGLSSENDRNEIINRIDIAVELFGDIEPNLQQDQDIYDFMESLYSDSEWGKLTKKLSKETGWFKQNDITGFTIYARDLYIEMESMNDRYSVA